MIILTLLKSLCCRVFIQALKNRPIDGTDLILRGTTLIDMEQNHIRLVESLSGLMRRPLRPVSQGWDEV
jgi:hypothetical protein